MQQGILLLQADLLEKRLKINIRQCTCDSFVINLRWHAFSQLGLKKLRLFLKLTNGKCQTMSLKIHSIETQTPDIVWLKICPAERDCYLYIQPGNLIGEEKLDCQNLQTNLYFQYGKFNRLLLSSCNSVKHFNFLNTPSSSKWLV